jgi:LemA protein
VTLTIIIVLVVIAVVVLALVAIYNSLVKRRNQVDNSWSQIDVQLRRRHDLIPNLVEAVKDYMEFEQDTLTRVTEARNMAVAAGQRGPEAQAQAENMLSDALKSLFAVAENYPDLKASTNFLELQRELATLEEDISFARRYYNATVEDLNTRIQTIPTVLIARPMGFSEKEYFKAEGEARAVPDVGGQL